MELSVQSKLKSEEILARRKEMLKKERLHIKEKIDYETFMHLYSQYGGDLEKKDFAYAFFDVDDVAYKNLESGKNNEMIILSREYVSDKELIEIRDRVIKKYGFKTGDNINTEQLMEIYEEMSDRISFRTLAEEILGMPVERARKLRRGTIKDTIVNFDIIPGQYCISHGKEKEVPDYYEINFIKALRERVITEEQLLIRESFSHERLIKLQKKYCPEMPETAFGEEILDLEISAQNRMKGKRKLDQSILERIEIPEEYIKRIQDKIIISYKIEPGQSMQKALIYELYTKYGTLLIERDFIQKILEVSDQGYNRLKDENSVGAIVFKSRTTNYKALRNRIIRENKLHYDDMIRYTKFDELHQKYAPNMPEKTFAREILDINHTMLQHIKYDGGRARILLEEPLPTKEEMKKLQTEVIQTENLHMEDKINHKQLKRLHEQYGGIISMEMFATEILAMEKQGYDRIKNPEDKDGNENTRKSMILVKIKIDSKVIEEIKEKIIKKHNLEEKRKVSLKEIEELYSYYGGIMSFKMFHRNILGVSNKAINNIRYGMQDGVWVHIRKKMSTEERKELKTYLAQDMSKLEIARIMDIRVSYLEAFIKELSSELTASAMLYEKVKLLKKSGKSLKDISDMLGISSDETRDMLTRYRIEKDAEEEALRLKKRRERENKKEAEKRAKIEKKARKILEDYEFDSENIKNVRKYIAICQERFEQREEGEETFSEEELLFLSECMEFVICNCQEIGLFAKICISQNKYQMASNFISENMSNDGITREEKEVLRTLQRDINYAIKKEQAFYLLERGIEDIKLISEKTGVFETDIIKLKRSLNQRNMLMRATPKKTDGDFIGI